jgi:hypothetical protein
MALSDGLLDDALALVPAPALLADLEAIAFVDAKRAPNTVRASASRLADFLAAAACKRCLHRRRSLRCTSPIWPARASAWANTPSSRGW